MHYINKILYGKNEIPNSNAEYKSPNNKEQFDPNDISGMKINGEEFKIQKISGYSKEYQKLTGHIKEAFKEEQNIGNISKNKIETPAIKQPVKNIAEDITINNQSLSIWDVLKEKITQIKPAIEKFKQSISGTGNNTKELDLVKYKISEIEEKLEKVKNGELHLKTKDIVEAEAQLERLNNKKDNLEKGSKGNFFSGIFSSFNKIIPSMNNVSGTTIKIKNQIKQWSGGIKSGLGNVLKYAGALFSLRSIYSALSSSAQAWLGSQNSEAKQLKANIEYMKYAMGSALAPVIQFVTNCVYQLLKAVQSVVYALSKVNIFANASASAFKSAQKQAKNTSKSLSSIHSEINNVGDHDSNSSPDVGDMSQISDEMSPLSQKLYDFFKPLKDSWEKYGNKIINGAKNAFSGILASASAMWNSVIEIISNGTIYSIIVNILNSIGKIGQAWANAWNNDDNGTEIIQGLANIIDDITRKILELVSSSGFQEFLNGVLSALSGIIQFVEPVVSGFVDMAKVITDIILSEIGKYLEGIGNVLQVIGQNKTAVEILKAVGAAIAIVVAAIVLWNVAQAILNGLMGLFTILTSPITLVILAVVAAIALIIVAVKNWGAISEWFQNLWITITEKIKEVWNNIKNFFVNLWNNIIETAKAGWNEIKNIITNIITNIKNTISNILNTIKSVWNNAWNGIKNFVIGIWNGIWNGIKSIINKILGGIESFVNNTIKGINKLLSGVSKVASAVGSLIGLSPISLQINTISLPRLAKGNVAYDETLAVFGEYSGASNNPEITAPQSIMRETFEDVLSDFNSSNGRPVHVTIQYLGRDIFDDTIDYINSKTRRTGKNTIVTVGD